jgi:hypothetical protein
MSLLEGLAEEASFLERRMETIEHEIPRIKSWFAIITSIRWTMVKPDMEALLVLMPSF